MKAIGRNLIIEKIKEGTTETKGGLLLTENQKEDIRYIMANVISVGDETAGIKEGDQIYINESLCTYYRKLRGRCGSLKKANKIHKVIVRNGIVKIKMKENDTFIDIKHESDLVEL